MTIFHVVLYDDAHGFENCLVLLNAILFGTEIYIQHLKAFQSGIEGLMPTTNPTLEFFDRLAITCISNAESTHFFFH